MYTQRIPRYDHLSPIKPPLSKPSQTIDSGISLTLTQRETQGKPNKTAVYDYFIPMEPPLTQPSQLKDFGISNFLTEGTSKGKEGCTKDVIYNPGQKKGTEETSTLENNSPEVKKTTPRENKEITTYGSSIGTGQGKYKSNTPVPNYHSHQ